jgi:KUP system potassium uptake protein
MEHWYKSTLCFQSNYRLREINLMLVYGGVSCVFWTLVFQTTIKYIWLTLRADNHGEGGFSHSMH